MTRDYADSFESVKPYLNYFRFSRDAVGKSLTEKGLLQVNEGGNVPAVRLTWHVGDVIRKLRGKQSQTAFGRRSGSSRPTIYRIETFGTGYTDVTLEGIAKAAGVTVTELLQAVPPNLSDEMIAVVNRFWLLEEPTRKAFLALARQAIENKLAEQATVQ